MSFKRDHGWRNYSLNLTHTSRAVVHEEAWDSEQVLCELSKITLSTVARGPNWRHPWRQWNKYIKKPSQLSDEEWERGRARRHTGGEGQMYRRIQFTFCRCSFSLFFLRMEKLNYISWNGRLRSVVGLLSIPSPPRCWITPSLFVFTNCFHHILLFCVKVCIYFRNHSREKL